MAAGGAVLVLVSVALALVLHYHRFRYAAKKTDHSITYKTSHYTNGAPLAVEPTLTIKLEQDRSSHCWGPKQGRHPKQTRKTANTLPRFCTFFSSPSLCVNAQTSLSRGPNPVRSYPSRPFSLGSFVCLFSFCWFQCCILEYEKSSTPKHFTTRGSAGFLPETGSLFLPLALSHPSSQWAVSLPGDLRGDPDLCVCTWYTFARVTSSVCAWVWERDWLIAGGECVGVFREGPL